MGVATLIKAGKYRYTLQFGMDTEKEQRAGNFLERLGNRKSSVVVAALNEFLQNHPELCENNAKVQFTIPGIDPRMLEAKIRQIVAEHLGSGITMPSQVGSESPDAAQQVSNDILDMLNDLDFFE